jgi:ribonuclease R
MQILYRQRLARGSIDFDLPEGDVILDSEGFTVGVRPGERSVAHRIIEECMIAANEAVAFELESHEVPALYRVHDPPNRSKLEELKEILQPLGIALKGDLEDLHPSAFQKILRRVEGKEEEPFVSSLVLRAMNQALYDPECRGHYALGSRHYTHFTSPIRRYPDLLVHGEPPARPRPPGSPSASPASPSTPAPPSGGPSARSATCCSGSWCVFWPAASAGSSRAG